MKKQYPNLVATGKMLVAYGTAIKVLGYLFGAVGVLFVIVTIANGNGSGHEKAFVGGVILGIGLVVLTIHAGGTIIAASGEAMNAVADIATNSWPNDGTVSTNNNPK